MHSVYAAGQEGSPSSNGCNRIGLRRELGRPLFTGLNSGAGFGDSSAGATMGGDGSASGSGVDASTGSLVLGYAGEVAPTLARLADATAL